VMGPGVVATAGGAGAGLACTGGGGGLYTTWDR
jgi:hypothetical protein